MKQQKKQEEEFLACISSEGVLEWLLSFARGTAGGSGLAALGALKRGCVGRLTKEEAQQVREMYGKPNPMGGRHTQMSLAQHFNVSETTILRILRGVGPYKEVKAPMTEAEVQASAQRLLAMLDKPQEIPARDMADVTPEARDRLIAYGQWTEADEQAWNARKT